MTLDRRQLFSSVAAGAVLGAFTTAEAGQKKKKAPKLPKPTAAGKHEVRPLPFDAATLTGISREMMTSHHEKNYGGAVKNLNKVELELAKVTKDTPGFVVAALREKELTFSNSAILHEHYFGNLGGDGKRAGDIGKVLDASFGSAADWEEAFRAAAIGLGGGSGWVVLALSYLTSDLRIIASGNHTQALAFAQPLLVLDMYEHAYALDYGAGHATYIDAFFQNIRWDEVDARLSRGKIAAAAFLT